MAQDEMTLSDAIRNLRSELTDAMDAGRSARIRFKPGPIEVELAIKFTSEGSAGAKVKVLSLLDLSAGGKLGSEFSHKLKLSLQAVDAEGKPVQLAGSE